MNGSIFAPPQASDAAHWVDMVFCIELGFASFVVLLVAGLIIFFSVRYRRRSPHDATPRIGTHYGLEALWTSATFAVFVAFFFMGAPLYVYLKKPPRNAQVIYVEGKQWMWKFQHADGLREINDLHVAIGQPIHLIMSSEDVIHDVFIPAFRVKQDVLPGSYTSEWFTPTRTGVYHLFCSQYCGAGHSLMVGSVIVLTPADYDSWRAGLGMIASPAEAGRQVFSSYGCNQCHGQTAPTLAGLYMSKVKLQDGSTATADEGYLREAILEPNKHLVAGYPPIMPTFRGQLSVEQVNALVDYIKSLQPALGSPTTRRGDDSTLLHVTPNLPPAQRRPEVTPAPGVNNP